jgi:Periplasmic copper-binding protein (NosD)/Bacterial Ig domain
VTTQPRKAGRLEAIAVLCALAALGAPAATPRSPEQQAPIVSYVGPRGMLSGPVMLRARASSPGSRVVAVTFLLDGRPIGSDTTEPYMLDVDAGLLASGDHRLRVAAVDLLARRDRTEAIAVTTRKRTGRMLVVSPRRGLGHALAALRRGHVAVRLLPGRYELRDVQLGDGARLVGSGERTVLAPPSDEPYSYVLLLKGKGIRVSDLTIDGGGPGDGEGVAVGVFDGSSDVRLQRLQILRARTHGVSVWGAHSEVSVQSSRIEGNGTASTGVRARGSDASRDTSVIRTRIRGFRDYGILFAQPEYGRQWAALHALALDNVVTDVADPDRGGCLQDSRASGCGTNEGGIWSGGVEAAIIGNTIRRTRWDGIETVGSSTRTAIVANDIRDTRTGIYVERSTNDSLVSQNVIAGVESGIKVEWAHGGGSSARNTFSFNRIEARKVGLVLDVGADGNQIMRNVFAGGARPAVVLQGSSGNLLSRNHACGARGPLVREQSARREDGAPAESQGNRLVGNVTSARACR